MALTRRTLLQGALAGTALAGMGAKVAFASDVATLGDMTVTTLLDGNLILPPEFIFGPMNKADLAPILKTYGIGDGPLRPECNVTLLQYDGRTVLFDTGSGSGFQSEVGLLVDALEAQGVAPEDVTDVVFTHGHPDHLWGVLDDFDDPLFPEAAHMMGEAEWDYWWNPETVDTIEPARTTMAIGAKRRMETIAERMKFFRDGDEVLPGVAARGTYGHTPGHMSFELRSGSESLMVVGDAISNHHVAFAAPAWPSGSDQDRETAAATRLGLLDQMVADKMRIIGYHLPGGGMGHVERVGEAFRFVPQDA